MTDEKDEQTGLGYIEKLPFALGDMARVIDLAGILAARGIPSEIEPHSTGDGYARDGWGPSEQYDLLVPLDMIEQAARAVEEHDQTGSDAG